MDVAVATIDPAGTKLAEFDSPNGRTGPEVVRLTATTAGNYTIEVRSIEEGAPAGAYDIRVLAMGAKPSTPAEEMDAYLANYSTTDAPGLAIAVMKNGESIYRKGYGMADLEHNVSVTPNTVFHVASISKQFTALAALLLAAEGKLSLDEDVRKYLPELPIYAHPITIRDLAQHTSGLRDVDELLRLSGIGQDDAATNAEVLGILLRQTGLNFTPGTAFEYSNSGFILLAEVVARVSGKPFSTFMQERVFTPLGMKDTRILDMPGAVVPNKAYSYGAEGSTFVKRPVNHTIIGSTGLNTTVDDLCLWAKNFGTPVVGDRALIDRLQRSGTLANGDPISYALGLDHKTYRAQHVIFHGGGDAGYRAYLVCIPEHRFVVAITSNAQEFNPVEAAERAIDYFLAEEVERTEPKASTKKPRRSKYDPLTGEYEIFPGRILSVKRADRGLAIQFAPGDAPVPLEEVDENVFKLGNAYNRFVFHTSADGKAYRLDNHIYDFTWGGPKVTLAPVDVAAIRSADFLGTYLSSELGGVLSVAVSDGGLVVSGHRGGPFPMRPFQRDSFTTEAGHMGLLTFERDGKGAINGCRVSGSRARNILFERVR
ncbi:MAG: serine hydrolase [Flavobacteriales bacterium]|nr:serine hydrolase [Flavobacteriales bacterium]